MIVQKERWSGQVSGKVVKMIRRREERWSDEGACGGGEGVLEMVVMLVGRRRDSSLGGEEGGMTVDMILRYRQGWIGWPSEA